MPVNTLHASFFFFQRFNQLLADPWRYAAISIECVACNCGDLFNDRGISKKPEKHA